MKLPYPSSRNLDLSEFPPVVEVRLGENGNGIVQSAAPFSRFWLKETPKSDVAQGDYYVGAALPTRNRIYSDTGSDDDYSLKLSFGGYGTFFLLTENDKYISALVHKEIKLETNLLDGVIFSRTAIADTLIARYAGCGVNFLYDNLSVEYERGDGFALIGLNGTDHNLSNGSSITLTMKNGDIITISYNKDATYNEEITLG